MVTEEEAKKREEAMEAKTTSVRYVAIAKQAGRRTQVFGPFDSFDAALDYAQHADPIDARWSVDLLESPDDAA